MSTGGGHDDYLRPHGTPVAYMNTCDTMMYMFHLGRGSLLVNSLLQVKWPSAAP